MKRTLGRYFPGTVFLALVSILSPTNAYASVIAKASNSTAQSILSATFKVAPEVLSGDQTTGPLTLSSGVNGTDYYRFFKNIGTVDVKTFSWNITQTVATGSYTLDVCPVGQTFSTATSCSNSTFPTPLALSGITGPALTVGQWQPIHLNISKKSDVFTVSSSVSGAQIRIGTNTTA